MENLPEVHPDQPLAPPETGARELVVSGGEVYLPDSGRFRPDDPEFAAVVNDVLPDYAASLSEEALRRPRGYPVWAIILILLFLGSLIAAFFFLRPRVRLETTSMKVPPPEVTTYAGEFARQYKEAMECVKVRRDKDARKCLSPVVDQLLKRGEAGRKNEPIFYSYFALFERLPWDAEAEAQLKRLIELDDQYRWELFDVLCQLALAGGEKPGDLSENATVDSLYAVMGKIDRLRRRLADKPESIRMLDLCKCHFGLKVWRLLNRPEPDDELGVGDREEVWEIASRYPLDIGFIDVRLYLVRQLIRDDPSGYYTFKGRRLWREKFLEDALRELEALKRRGEK